MRCPTLNQLPPPHKTGWPWTKESPSLPGQMSDGRPWPKISIVTPSFNQGNFLEQTIRSVLLQGYPNLEYIIIDGGSSDDSPKIIARYEPWLTYAVSEPDRGQAHALNKGFARCSGDLLSWINSDDYLLPNVLALLARVYVQNPRTILLGDVIDFADSGGFVQVIHQKNITLQNMVDKWRLYTLTEGWGQQGTYVPYSLYQEVGDLDESLRYVFDRDWMCRLLQIAPVYYLGVPVASYRKHPTSKTVAEIPAWLPEEVEVTQRYLNQLQNSEENRVRAGLEMHMAFIFLSLTQHWNRQRGLAHLRQALRYDWRVFLSLSALALCARAIMPKGFLHLTKKLWLWLRNMRARKTNYLVESLV
jgi:glycosyltransferase involved in cell wall biosynthesis